MDAEDAIQRLIDIAEAIRRVRDAIERDPPRGRKLGEIITLNTRLMYETDALDRTLEAVLEPPFIDATEPADIGKDKRCQPSCVTS